MDFIVGDVWLAKFPYEDCPEMFKPRPVVVLGKDIFGILSVKVTSHEPRFEDKYDMDIYYWCEAGLRMKSTARVSKTIFLTEDRFISKLGTLVESDLERIKELYIEYVTEQGI